MELTEKVKIIDDENDERADKLNLIFIFTHFKKQ